MELGTMPSSVHQASVLGM